MKILLEICFLASIPGAIYASVKLANIKNIFIQKILIYNSIIEKETNKSLPVIDKDFSYNYEFRIDNEFTLIEKISNDDYNSFVID